MLLQTYPTKIAAIRRKLLSLDQDLDTTREVLSVINTGIEATVLLDSTLTNDAKRKIRRQELQLDSANWFEAQDNVKELQTLRTMLEIDLEEARNTFEVLKLDVTQKTC